MTCDQSDEELQAWWDGELEPSRAVGLEQHVAGCPACQRRLQFFEDLRAALQAHTGVPPVPPHLEARLRTRLQQGAGRQRLSRQAAGAMLAVALLGFLGGGFWLFSRQRPPALLAELMEIHTGLARSELPLTYPSSDAEMLQRWLGQRLPFRPFIPRVEATGFDLLGARTLSLLNREGAVLLLAKEGHKVSLISLPEGGHIQTFGKKKTRKGMQFWIFAQGIYSVVLWAEQGLLYAMVSDEDVDDLLEYARLCVLQMRAPT